MSKLDTNVIMSYPKLDRAPCKGDVFLRMSDRVHIYIFGTCINMSEGEEGELMAAYMPLHGPYDTLYVINCKELIDSDKHKFVREGFNLSEQMLKQFHAIEEMLEKK